RTFPLLHFSRSVANQAGPDVPKLGDDRRPGNHWLDEEHRWTASFAQVRALPDATLDIQVTQESPC
ncbi:hypothetical protein ACIBO2_35180, partial [Nonomuraea sp. NPDC050022]|uniref:hypothetical protein n=1 Tax=unclassified Nonomuraea TaxID=2593643 RepID=UPI0033CB2D75